MTDSKTLKLFFKELGSSIFLTLMFPVMLIDMAIHPKAWDEFFADDPLFNEFENLDY